MLLTIVKKIKMCGSKEWKFDWALTHLEKMRDDCQNHESLKVSLNKIEEAILEVKMDQHDHDVPVSPDLYENTEGWFGEYWYCYALVGIAAVGAGAVYYQKHVKK